MHFANNFMGGFFSCRSHVSLERSLESLKLKHNIESDTFLVVNWDHCHSCRYVYPRMIERYLSLQDIQVIAISNQIKKVFTQLCAGEILMMRPEEMMEYDIYPIIPTLYIISDSGKVELLEVDLSEYGK
ncbi:hypothetical protein FKX85_08230 [Echinicola soli]|uniref:Thioredoxin n=1 Tax=Echinicola soli TaxID=2591634 RepID=A0A514CH75_9BACT|nr:hypothetical protein [Echinicola soli]QDH79024.1 hypothetical protein FKX85_08230 [Echinicola soli]